MCFVNATFGMANFPPNKIFFCPPYSSDVRLAFCLDSLQKALAEETKQNTQLKKEKTTC